MSLWSHLDLISNPIFAFNNYVLFEKLNPLLTLWVIVFAMRATCHQWLVDILSPVHSWTPTMCFRGGSAVKNPPADVWDTGLIPGSGRSPGEGDGNPLQYSCLGNPGKIEVPGGLQSRGLQMVRHGLATKQQQITCATHMYDRNTEVNIVSTCCHVAIYHVALSRVEDILKS